MEYMLKLLHHSIDPLSFKIEESFSSLKKNIINNQLPFLGSAYFNYCASLLFLYLNILVRKA